MPPRRLAPLSVLLLLCLSGSATPARDDAPLQGLVLVTVDTLRADHVGPYGGPVPTPAFESLAREGVLVEQAYTPIPTTAPAHASLLTGLHPWRHRLLDNAVPLDADLTTLAGILREEGFASAAFISSYMLHPRFGLDRGFDLYEFEPTESYVWRGEMKPGFWARGGSVTERALGWLNQRAVAGAGRFFLWVHYFDPHAPYQPPEGFAVSPTHPVDLRGKLLPPGVSDSAALRRLLRAYRGEVRYADAQIGRLVERLRILGLLDRTALIVTSDHGEGLGDHGLLEHTANLYEELVRVPLFVRAPGIGGGRRLGGPAQLEDLFPTALALLGVSIPEGLDGQNLAPWLRGEVEDSPRAAVRGRRKVRQGWPNLYYERRGPFKWIGELDHPGTVYTLDRDPAERKGKQGESAPPELRVLTTPTQQSPEAPARLLDPEVRRALEALGYVD